jgi:hypothetical protein
MVSTMVYHATVAYSLTSSAKNMMARSYVIGITLFSPNAIATLAHPGQSGDICVVV